jgi:hypothetical protein
MLTGDGELGHPPMARRQRSSRRRRVWRRGEGAGDASECEGDNCRGYGSVFIEQGGEESHGRAAKAINGHGGRRLYCLQERGAFD